jgi:PQQ-dependent dehydrogenase (methanol/ethanol family)
MLATLRRVCALHATRSAPARRIASILSFASLVNALAACGGEAPQQTRAPSSAAPQSPAPRAANGAIATAVLDSEDGQWTRPMKSYNAIRYSGLTEINASNVASLKSAWTFSTGVLRGHEEAPIVVNGTMYLLTPFPNILYAIDLSGTSGKVKWQYEPKPESAAQGVACCDVVNRGPSFADGKIVFNTLDNHVVAVDANTGKAVWNTKVGDINVGETMTMAPLVVKNHVLVGNSGGEMGVRGWLKSLDLANGSVQWTAYSTGPDSDVLIGPRFTAHYAKDRGKDLGVSTWSGTQWRNGGGSVWGWLSYDPELDLVYYGSGNPGPWNPDQRPGDNKWTSTLFARDPDTGEAVWGYQVSPHDLHDYDGVNEALILDVPWKGTVRKALVRPERNGYVYLHDRTTGEVLSAQPFVHITTTTGVDLKTGLLQYNPAMKPKLGEVVRDICPASPGGKDWQPSSFSPRTGLIYIPHQNLCEDEEGLEANYIAGTPYVGMNVRMQPGPGGHRGEFTAWDPVAMRAAWKLKENFPVWSGTLVTAGDVVFYGTMDGWFKALDARTGALLWQHQVGSGIISQPITYRGVDGKQYVAVVAGVGGWAGAIVAGGLDPRDSTAALGFVAAMTDLPKATSKGGTLYVFALP